MERLAQEQRLPRTGLAATLPPRAQSVDLLEPPRPGTSFSRPYTAATAEPGGGVEIGDGVVAAGAGSGKDLEKMQAEAVSLLYEACVLAEDATEIAAVEEAIRAALLHPQARGQASYAVISHPRVCTPPSRLSTALSRPGTGTSFSWHSDGARSAAADSGRIGARATARVAKALLSPDAAAWASALRLLSGGLWKPWKPAMLQDRSKAHGGDEDKSKADRAEERDAISPYEKKKRERGDNPLARKHSGTQALERLGRALHNAWCSNYILEACWC